MRDKCDRSTQCLYGWTVEIDLMIAKLVLSQLKWKGISQDNTRILFPRIKDALLYYLQFQGLDDVVDIVSFSTNSYLDV